MLAWKAVREALTIGASPGSGGSRDVGWFHIKPAQGPFWALFAAFEEPDICDVVRVVA